MILPSKHITFSESLLGLGGILLAKLTEPATVDEIWQHYKYNNQDRKLLRAYHSFDDVVLCLNFLFLINAIAIDQNGKLNKCA